MFPAASSAATAAAAAAAATVHATDPRSRGGAGGGSGGGGSGGGGGGGGTSGGGGGGDHARGSGCGGTGGSSGVEDNAEQDFSSSRHNVNGCEAWPDRAVANFKASSLLTTSASSFSRDGRCCTALPSNSSWCWRVATSCLAAICRAAAAAPAQLAEQAEEEEEALPRAVHLPQASSSSSRSTVIVPELPAVSTPCRSGESSAMSPVAAFPRPVQLPHV